MAKKLVFINPKSDFEYFNPGAVCQPLAFGYLAALTPPDWDIKFIDEDLEKFSFIEADLVGITTLTATANRAYQIAGIYRERGVKVVLGGIHASMLPEEALKFCDAVVAGEAESIWPEVISDFENGKLKSIYKGEYLPLESAPIPRRDIFGDRYVFDVIQTSRGCPMDCDFCSVAAFNGYRYRMRPAAQVLDELEAIRKKRIFFSDDNLIGYGDDARDRAKEIFKGMIKKRLNKAWLAQVSINFADDEEILFYAAKSGCVGVLVGFESVSQETLKGMNKNLNLRYGVDYYRKMVEKLHRFGMAVNGQIILGNDGDRPETFEQTADLIDKAAIDIPNIPLLVPYPGTKLFKRLRGQGRLLHTDFPKDWQLYSGQKLLYGPANLTKQQIEEGYRYMIKNLFSFRKRLGRVIKAARYVRDWRLLLAIWIFNSSINETYSKKALVRGF